MKYTRDAMIHWLSIGECEVHFTKVDGTVRFMKCTLNSNLIPEKFEAKSVGRKQSENSVAVYDLEVKDWRSFRVDSVENFTHRID